MAKSRKIVISIYLGTVFIACTTYLALILIGSLQGNDMSNSVLDTDHRYINHYKEAAKSDTSNGTSNHSLNHSNQQGILHDFYPGYNLFHIYPIFPIPEREKFFAQVKTIIK